MAKPPVSEQIQVNFRMPVDLRDRIKIAAEVNNRSMNAELIAALEEMYPASDFDLGTFIEKWSKRLKGMKDPMDASRLAFMANKELEAAGSEWRLHVPIEGNKFFVRFYSLLDGPPSDNESPE